MNTEPRKEHQGTRPAANQGEQDKLASTKPGAKPAPKADPMPPETPQEGELDEMLEQSFPASDPLPGPREQ